MIYIYADRFGGIVAGAGSQVRAADVCVCVCVCVCVQYMLINEDALSQVPGVKYVPLVGKVTVGMLERNLIRLIKQFQLQE